MKHLNSAIMIIAVPVLCIVTFTGTASAQVFDLEARAVKEYTRGVTTVAASLLSDSLSPMTHYRQGEWRVSLVPSYFNVKQINNNPDIHGRDLMGWSLGLGGGYAFTDRIMTYAIITYARNDGDITGSFYGPLTVPVRAGNSFSIFSAALGAGFDLIGGDSWISIPLFAGFTMTRFRVDVNIPPVTAQVFSPTDMVDLSLSDGGTVSAFTVGFAVSVELFRFIRITPYYFYMAGMNRPRVSASARIASGALPLPLAYDYDLDSDMVNAGLFGFALSTRPKRKISVSVSLGGILSSSAGFYSKTFLNGLRMTSVTVTISYNGIPDDE